jgi:hypothetical protein
MVRLVIDCTGDRGDDPLTKDQVVIGPLGFDGIGRIGRD